MSSLYNLHVGLAWVFQKQLPRFELTSLGRRQTAIPSKTKNAQFRTLDAWMKIQIYRYLAYNLLGRISLGTFSLHQTSYESWAK